MRSIMSLVASLVALHLFAFVPPNPTNSVTRGPVTYAQRGGFSLSTYVVTNVDENAVLTTNLVGKTLTTGTNTVVNLGPGTVVRGTDDMSITMAGGSLVVPANLSVTVRGDRTLSTWGVTNALENDETFLTNSTAFRGAVEKVSPPTVLPEKWALSDVTNGQGTAVTAVNVNAFPLTAFVEEYTTARAWSYGDYCLHGGKLWIAVDNTQQGREWDPDRWEESTDYTTPLGVWLSKGYVDLGPGGTNLYDLVRSVFVKKVNVGIDTDSKYRYLRLTPQHVGLENADQTKYVRISPASVEYKDGSGTGSTITWGNIRTTANASSIDASSIDPAKTYLYTSPYHVWSYLQSQGYLTPSAGDLRYVAKGSDVTASKVGDDYHWQDADGGYYYRPTTWTDGTYTYTQQGAYWWTDLTSVGQSMEYHIEYSPSSGQWMDVNVAHAGAMTRTQVVNTAAGSYTNSTIVFRNRTYARSVPATVVKQKQVAYLSDLSPYALSSSLKPVATTGSYSDLTGLPELKPFATNANAKVSASDIQAGVIPTTLPNPQKLKFSGAASGDYDGSSEKTVVIPEAVTDQHIRDVATGVSALRYDSGLNVTWTNVVHNGRAYYVTVTNANIVTP